MGSLHVVMVCKTNLEIWLLQDWVSDSGQVCFKTLIVICLFSDLRVELDWTDSIKKCSVKHVVRAKKCAKHTKSEIFLEEKFIDKYLEVISFEKFTNLSKLQNW